MLRPTWWFQHHGSNEGYFVGLELGSTDWKAEGVCIFMPGGL